MAAAAWSAYCERLSDTSPATASDAWWWTDPLAAFLGAVIAVAGAYFISRREFRHQARLRREEEQRAIYRRARAISIELTAIRILLSMERERVTEDATRPWSGIPDRAVVLEALVEHVGEYGEELTTAFINCISALTILRNYRANWESEKNAPRPKISVRAIDPRRAKIEKAGKSLLVILNYLIDELGKASQLLNRDFPPRHPEWERPGLSMPDTASKPATETGTPP
ncbi:MAG: hypothetical protein EXQ98_02700 [Alphaproteobacteria bacterium]|nr:hypothetical protein [Alphaproteobacteria bacterium]